MVEYKISNSMAQDIMHKDILLIDLHLGIITNCLLYCRASQKKEIDVSFSKD